MEFTARRGEVLALLGPNGAGKTTTIEILEGFRMRSAGEVRVLGVDPARVMRWRARIGVVLQSWRTTAGKGVARAPGTTLLQHAGSQAPLRHRRPDRGRGSRRARGKKISALSGGQRRRMDVAIGIVGRPELLFLDEPTAGFDPHARGASSTTSCIVCPTWRTPRYR